MAPVKLVRDRVEVRGVGEAMVECGVEHGDLRDAGAERTPRRRDAAEVVRVVERGELD
jgi:hypothetical protein